MPMGSLLRGGVGGVMVVLMLPRVWWLLQRHDSLLLDACST